MRRHDPPRTCGSPSLGHPSPTGRPSQSQTSRTEHNSRHKKTNRWTEQRYVTNRLKQSQKTLWRSGKFSASFMFTSAPSVPCFWWRKDARSLPLVGNSRLANGRPWSDYAKSNQGLSVRSRDKLPVHTRNKLRVGKSVESHSYFFPTHKWICDLSYVFFFIKKKVIF